MDPITPAAGDTVNNESGEPTLPVNVDPSYEKHQEPNANKPTQGDGNGIDSISSEAEKLIQEAQEVAKKAIQDKEKAESKIVQLKRDGKDIGSEQLLGELTEYKDETTKRFDEIQKARDEDKEAMKIVVESLLKKTRETNELKAIVASQNGSIPNLSSHNPPVSVKEGEYSYADTRIAKHFGVELK